MNNFADTISESITQLGQAFLVAYYLPASVFVLVHLYILIPVWAGTAPGFLAAAGEVTLPLIGNADLASLIGTLLLPLVAGIVLVGLNGVLIVAFEGRPWWLRYGLLYPLARFNRKRCETRYGNLNALRAEYRRVSALLLRAPPAGEASSPPPASLQQQLAGLAMQIDEEQRAVEAKYPVQIIPHELRRVCPTAFGNAYAIAEEYAFERYGADSVLFWPRLRELMYEAAEGHSERVTQQKTSLDLSLNLAFICGLLSLEAMLTLRFGPPGHDGLFLLLALLGGVLCASYYRASIGAVHTQGELIKNSFDYHRGLVLEAFDLEKPEDLLTEQAVWVRLATFVRRGEPFYFPADARKGAQAEEAEAEASAEPPEPPTATGLRRWLSALYRRLGGG
jgi:hypothetical protein